MLKTKYAYHTGRKEWMGLVIEQCKQRCTVLTIGCEATEREIKVWLERAVEVQPWIEGNQCVPDMYDRGVVQPQ